MSAVNSPTTATPNVDGFVNFVLKQIGDDAFLSQELLKAGAKTKLAQLIEAFAIDPFSYRIDMLKKTHGDLIEMVDKYVMAYLDAKKHYIKKIYKFNTVTGINYFIILKDDNTENREVFFQLLDHYESLKINAILPLNLSFLPEQVIDKMTLEELSLSE